MNVGWPHAFFAARTACSPTWSWINPEGHRDLLNLWLIIDGRGSWESRGRTFTLAAGDCFVQRLWHGCQGTTDPGDPLVVLWCNVSLRGEDGSTVPLRTHVEEMLPQLYRRIDDLAFISQLAMRLITVFEQQGPGAAADRWLSCIWDEIASCDGADTRHAHAFESMMSAVRAQPERPWTVSGLASSLDLPVDRFSRQFHAQTGMSPREFLMRSRLDQAKAELRMSSLSVGAIAARLGFCDIYHFSRRFRQHVGCSPSAYRAGMGCHRGHPAGISRRRA